MSIGIYAFLRIYFLSFGLSAFAQFRTHCPTSSAAAVPIAQRAQRPGVCVCAWRGLPCRLCRVAVPGTLEWAGMHRQGIQGTPGGGAGHARDKIFQRKRRFSGFLLLTPTPLSQIRIHPIVQVSKFSEKYKKTPLGA